jgi:hypothetical protein
LQNELPRDDGQGKGYAELMLQSDVMGTVDGLSKNPYIRESRRILGQSRAVEHDIVAELQRRARGALISGFGWDGFLYGGHPPLWCGGTGTHDDATALADSKCGPTWCGQGCQSLGLTICRPAIRMLRSTRHEVRWSDGRMQERSTHG